MPAERGRHEPSSNTGRYKGSRPEKAAVAAALAPDACLCYLSALSFYAGEHNVMFSASISVEFDGVTYLPYRYQKCRRTHDFNRGI